MLERMSTIGTNWILVTSRPNPRAPHIPLTIADAEAIASLPNVSATMPSKEKVGFVSHGDNETRTEIIGSTRAHTSVHHWNVTQGRFYTEEDERLGSAVAVLGKTSAGRLDEKGRDLIARCVRAVDHMDRLTADLLSYARLQRGSEPFADVDLNAVVDEAKTLLAAPIAQSGAVIDVGALPVVRGAAGELIRLFENLLSNAIKYRGAQPPRIRIDAARTARGWLVSVTGGSATSRISRPTSSDSAVCTAGSSLASSRPSGKVITTAGTWPGPAAASGSVR